MEKYVLLFVCGGLNDIFVTLNRILKYCKRYNRILLFDMKNTLYNINFANYFDIDDKDIIYDSDEIKNIIFKNNITLYPTNLNANINDISELFYKFYNGEKKTQRSEHNSNIFKYNNYGKFSINGVNLKLPSEEIKKDIIIHATGGGGLLGLKFLSL